jgi:hypothetical protein
LFTFKTGVVILSGGHVGRTAYTHIVVASSGIAGYLAFTSFVAPTTNHCQEKEIDSQVFLFFKKLSEKERQDINVSF